VTQAERLSIEVTRSGGSAAITVVGEVDMASAPSLRKILGGCIDEGCRKIRLEMSEVSFMDSSGIAALLSAKQRIDEGDGELVLSNPSRNVRRVLELTALNSVFTITPAEADTAR